MRYADAIYEGLVLRPFFDEVVARVCTRRSEPGTVELGRVLAGMSTMGAERLAALAFVCHHADSVEEGGGVVGELVAYLEKGRRPRTLREMAEEAGWLP